MLWLADHGFRVAGIEINERAVAAFFSEAGLQPEVVTRGGAAHYRSGRIEVFHADFFHFDPSMLPEVEAVYDRAALVALPPGMRAAYAARLSSLVPPGAPMLLITLDYPQAEMRGPPFAVPASEVHGLFGDAFDIRPLHSEDCLAREPRFRKKGLSRMFEEVHLLRKRS